MPISEYAGDYTAYRDDFYHSLRSAFISDDGDSTFATDDASTTDAPDVSVFQAILWAIATGAGIAQEQIERAGNNRNPALAQELLGLLERDYQVIPSYGSTIADRQSALALRARVARGASQGAIFDALTEILGDDLVAVQTNDAWSTVRSWPDSPGDVGVFDTPNAERKIFKITSPVSITGVPRTVTYEAVGNSNPPIPGETYCVDPNTRSPNIEKITIASVSGSTFTATFSKPHPPGTYGARPHPVWTSNQRITRVVVSVAAATDPTIRRRINDYLSRALRGVSRWSIVSDEGSFLLGHATRGILGATALTDTPGGGGATGMAAGFASARSSAAAVGSSAIPGAAAGSASATSSAAAVGAASKQAAGAANGTSSAAATSNAQKRSAGSATATTNVRGFKG